MAKIRLFVTLATALIITFIDEVYTGETERFVLHAIEDASPTKDWMKLLTLNTHDEEYVSLSTQVFKKFPDDAVIKTIITYAGKKLPEHEMLLCDSFEEKMFGDDVKQKGFPQPGFPQHCPFGPHEFIEIRDWKFPHYKIPDGTAPGPVIVNITFSSGDDIMMKINAEGEVTQELYSSDSMTPKFGL